MKIKHLLSINRPITPIKTTNFIYVTLFLKDDMSFSTLDNELVKTALDNCVSCNIMKIANKVIYIPTRFGWIPVALKQGTVNLNEDMNLLKLKTHLPLIIRTAHKMIQTIPDSDGVIGGTFGLANKNSTNEDTIVASILNKFIHDDSIRSILKLAAEIMFKINASHLYNNGNKRTSLVSAFAILRYFGYGVNKSPANLLKDWEHIVQNVANYQISDELGAESETIKYIENNIKKIIMVG